MHELGSVNGDNGSWPVVFLLLDEKKRLIRKLSSLENWTMQCMFWIAERQDLSPVLIIRAQEFGKS